MRKDLFKKFKWLNANFKNPINIGLFNQGIIDNCTLKFKDSRIKNIEINQSNKFVYEVCLMNYDLKRSFPSNVLKFLNSYEFTDKTCNFEGITFKNDITSWMFFEADEYYDKFPIKDRVVIDVGGNVGDSALNFAKRGATVYAFEAMPNICKIAEENISFNVDLKDKIHFYNKAISCKNGKMTIHVDEVNTGGHSEYHTEGTAYEIDTVSIDYLLNELNIKPDVLKMDCEGCEYNIILNSDLSMFKDIIFEYHELLVEKPRKLLIDKLEEQGFVVDLYENPCTPVNELGIIHAHK